MSNDDEATCGKGIAANASLTAMLAAWAAARAEVLERHTRALDLTDPNSSGELEAYAALVSAHRAIAADLDRLAQQMAGYHDLPAARHDMSVMADPTGQLEAFRRFVAIQRDLVALLQSKLAEAEEQLQ